MSYNRYQFQHKIKKKMNRVDWQFIHQPEPWENLFRVRLLSSTCHQNHNLTHLEKQARNRPQEHIPRTPPIRIETVTGPQAPVGQEKEINDSHRASAATPWQTGFSGIPNEFLD